MRRRKQGRSSRTRDLENQGRLSPLSQSGILALQNVRSLRPGWGTFAVPVTRLFRYTSGDTPFLVRGMQARCIPARYSKKPSRCSKDPAPPAPVARLLTNVNFILTCVVVITASPCYSQLLGECPSCRLSASATPGEPLLAAVPRVRGPGGSRRPRPKTVGRPPHRRHVATPSSRGHIWYGSL